MAFHGKQGSGAQRRLREIKREEALERAKTPTPVERTKAYRLGPLPTSGADVLPRTERSIRRYRDAFLLEHGVYPGESVPGA